MYRSDIFSSEGTEKGVTALVSQRQIIKGALRGAWSEGHKNHLVLGHLVEENAPAYTVQAAEIASWQSG